MPTFFEENAFNLECYLFFTILNLGLHYHAIHLLTFRLLLFMYFNVKTYFSANIF